MQQTPGSTGVWNGIEFTLDEVEECDLLVVFNRPHKPIIIKTRPQGRWLFTQESPVEMYRWHTRSFKYFDRVFTFWPKSPRYHSDNIESDQTSLPWHIGKSYDELKALQPGDMHKEDKLSWVTSNATHKPGHKLRMDFKQYLEEHNFPYDLFGRGFDPIDDKFNGIAPYKYSLAIENYACDDYWTEKIADCLLSWTLPVYYGCTNITDYFPEGAMLRIDPSNPDKAKDQIQKAIAGNLWEERLDDIAKARELILDKYQLFPEIAEKLGRSTPDPGHRWFYIPANAVMNKKERGLQLLTNIKYGLQAKLKNLLNA